MLAACHKLGCNCPAFHGTPDGEVLEPILEVFGRQFLTLNLKPVAPESAQLFSAVLRVLRQLEEALQVMSGVNGIYFGGETLREVFPKVLRDLAAAHGLAAGCCVEAVQQGGLRYLPHR